MRGTAKYQWGTSLPGHAPWGWGMVEKTPGPGGGGGRRPYRYSSNGNSRVAGKAVVVVAAGGGDDDNGGGGGNRDVDSSSSSSSRWMLRDVSNRRLIPMVLSIPKRLDTYFDKRPMRRVAWCCISAGVGFYAGNIATLSFGALAINDVFAAVVTLVFYEAVTKLFYSSPRPSLKLWFANSFKIGMTLSMLADAIKLGG